MKKLLAILLLCISCQAWSAFIIETFDLKHRPASEVIPVIKPMLASGASITGTGYKVIIKSTAENLETIETLIREIDIDKRQLKVYVSLGKQTEENRSETSVEGTVNSGSTSIEVGKNPDDRSKFSARIYESNNRANRPVIQQMSITEGYWGRISIGQSIPTATRTRNPDGTVTEMVTYTNVMTGYEVMPRTNGERITLSIKPIRQETGSSGEIETTELETTVTGKLGEWIYLGGTDHSENLRNSGITYNTRVRSTDINQIWVKVERP